MGGTVIDGTGADRFRADVAVKNGKIAALGNLTGAQAERTIDAAGKLVSPGFIDIHRHADAAVFRAHFGELELLQGLTGIVNGNCGLSTAPCSGDNLAQICSYLTPVVGEPAQAAQPSLAEYFNLVRAQELPVNFGMLAGLGTIRACAAGYDTLHLDAAQMKTVHEMLETALADGALGISLGLGYAPECFFTTDELIEALQPLKNSGYPVTVHMRQEGSGVACALQEMITVARALQTPVEISHLKSIGKANWRKTTPQMLELLRRAREDGVQITCDVYPYTAGSTQLVHVLPPECQQGGLEVLSRNLTDPAFRANLRERMLTGDDFENITLLAGWENVVASSIAEGENKQFEGKSIAEIAELTGKDPFDACFDLLAQEHCDVTMIDFITCDEDIAAILQDETSCVISDATYPTSGMLHPRVYGTYASLFETWVREKGVLSEEKAIAKVTSLPAARLNLAGKGKLIPGMDADINVFELEKIHANSTYMDPKQPASGFDYVMVGGTVAVEDGKLTGRTGGSILHR